MSLTLFDLSLSHALYIEVSNMGFGFCLSPSLDGASTVCVSTVCLGAGDSAHTNRSNEGQARPS